MASDNVPFGKISFANTASANAQTNDILASIAGEKVGSSNKGELTFSTSDSAAPTEKMRIDSSGNVGIGTASPQVKLETRGTASNTISSTTAVSKIVGNVGTGSVGLYSGSLAGSPNYGTWIQSMRETDNSAFQLLLNPNGGNVGIGTASPLKTLSVNGGDIAVNSGNSFIVGAATTGNTQIGELGADSGQLCLLTESTRDIKFASTTYGDIMFLEGTNGNVGIGTTSPSEKLNVDGNILATGTVLGSNLSGTNTGDQDISGIATNATNIGTNVTAIALNTAKISFDSVSSTRLVNTSGTNTGDQDLSGYVTTTTTQSISGQKTFTGAVTKFDTDFVEMGIAENGYRLNVGTNEESGSIYSIYATGRILSGTSIHATTTVTATSTMTASNFILSSDKRLKSNIQDVDNKHINVDWKTFELNSEKGQNRYGVIAQELEETHPEFVRTDDEGVKSVAYIDLLIAKNAELEARLERLERLLDKAGI